MNKIKIKGAMNPTVVTTSSGTYAVSGSNWIPVSVGTKISDLDWVDTSPKIKRYKLQTWEVESTSRKKPGKVNKYTVKFDGLYSCTCLGYTYRRKCRHITKISESFQPSRGRAGAGVV